MRYKIGDTVKLKSGAEAKIIKCDDNYYYVKDSNNNYKKIKLVKDASNSEIKDFLQKGVEFMMANQDYTLKCLNLNSQLCLALYWENGYGNNVREDVMQAEDLDWALVTSIKVRNQHEWDGSYLNTPANANGEYYVESITIVPNENYDRLANYINTQFEKIKDLTFDNKGIEEVKEAEMEDAIPYGVFAWKLNEIISAMNDEGAYYDSEWLYIWPDGEAKQEAIEDFSDKEDYAELEELFKGIYKEYHDGGLYTADVEIIELAHKYDEKFGLEPIEIISPVKTKDGRFDLNEGWYDKADGWTDEDIELHKSIDWKARDYEDYEIKNDTITTEVHCYRQNRRPETKTVKMNRYLRANGIFCPYYGLASGEKEPFNNVLGPMYDGDKHNGYMIMNRYEDQATYDMLSDSAPETPATDYDSLRKSLISADNKGALKIALNTIEDLFDKDLITNNEYKRLKRTYENMSVTLNDNMATLNAPLCKEGKCAEPRVRDAEDNEDELVNKYLRERQGSDNDDEIPTYDMELEDYEPSDEEYYDDYEPEQEDDAPKGYNILFLIRGGDEYKTIHYNDADEAYHDYEEMKNGIPSEYEDVILEPEW